MGIKRDDASEGSEEDELPDLGDLDIAAEAEKEEEGEE